MFPKKLINLYEKMAALTAPICANSKGDGCRAIHSCCDAIYCEMAIERAKSVGIELAITDHPKLPLMGEGGCVAPAYLRPICTVHVCCINGFGFKPNDPEWTKEYFRLRRAIDRNEPYVDLEGL